MAVRTAPTGVGELGNQWPLWHHKGLLFRTVCFRTDFFFFFFYKLESQMKAVQRKGSNILTGSVTFTQFVTFTGFVVASNSQPTTQLACYIKAFQKQRWKEQTHAVLKAKIWCPVSFIVSFKHESVTSMCVSQNTCKRHTVLKRNVWPDTPAVLRRYKLPTTF